MPTAFPGIVSIRGVAVPGGDERSNTMRSHIPLRPSSLWKLAVLACATTVWSGCGRLPTDPGSGSNGVVEDPQFLTAPDRSTLGFGARTKSDAPPQIIAQQWVERGQPADVSGGRYSLHFYPGSIVDRDGADVTIAEWSPSVLQVELGPHGIPFGVPVLITIDYSGTNADPSSSNYDGSTPCLLWFNEPMNRWEQVPGTDDPDKRKYKAKLAHFSRYAVVTSTKKKPGTAEW
jgi:hypothetical protein